MEAIHTNVEREWIKFLNQSKSGVPPDKKSKKWNWLYNIRNPKPHKLELDEALIRRLTGLANTETDNIKTRCTLIKLLFSKIRATYKQLSPDHLEILKQNGGNPEIEFKGKNWAKRKQYFMTHQPKQVKQRRREKIMEKIRSNAQLTKSEKKLMQPGKNNHPWYHCQDRTDCTNNQCWMAVKNQICAQCKEKTKTCICAERMRHLPCTGCGKPNNEPIHQGCGLKDDEEPLQEILKEALENYERNKKLKKVKIKSISHLATLMVGSGDEGHCIYNQRTKQWAPGTFLPSPKGIFDWNNLNGQGGGNTEFILDSGSQLNMIPMKELRKQGVIIEDLPEITLNMTGISGKMSATWYKFRVNVTSRTTGQSHFEELYTSSSCNVRLLSYATLIRLGHIDPESFTKKQTTKYTPKETTKQETVIKAYISKCEQSTTYDKQKMEFNCACPKREQPKPEELEEMRKKHGEKLEELLKILDDNKTRDEETIAESLKQLMLDHFRDSAFNTCENQTLNMLQQMLDHFRDSAFNTCENQTLNMLRDTEMDVHIRPEATPKRTMKPIPCPWNLRD